jgi:hypothetical protein
MIIPIDCVMNLSRYLSFFLSSPSTCFKTILIATHLYRSKAYRTYTKPILEDQASWPASILH